MKQNCHENSFMEQWKKEQIFGLHKTNVGASLLAKGPSHSTVLLTERPPSRARSLPQVLR
jgi:hypothetical protein